MIIDYLEELILHNFGFKPTQQQAEVVRLLSEFILSESQQQVFILRGYAGTGKTSLVGALVRTLEQVRDEEYCVLMAPTGRAAKVFSLYSDHPAYTIHKRIYRQKTFDIDSIFTLDYNLQRNRLFIADEASMISNDSYGGSLYGTGRLLDDMVQFVYGSEGCKLIIMGDTAQLPPVGEGESPALCDHVMQGYGLEVISYTLTQVVRQTSASGILWNATNLRELIDSEQIFQLPKIRFTGFRDVRIVRGDELIDELANCYSRDGRDETMVVCRSNKRALIYNNGIRSQVLWMDPELGGGDMVMIAKNNYYWAEQNKDRDQLPTNKQPQIDFIANGDIAHVRRVRNVREFYGFQFADCEMYLPDYDLEVSVVVLLDTLTEEAPALSRERQEILYNKVWEDYETINIAAKGERPVWKKANQQERRKAMKQDPYFNALQIKYAYAVTCHKAQGGQWENIFVDQGYMTDEMLGTDYFRWLYTAITRARKCVYFVNWSQEQVLE